MLVFNYLGGALIFIGVRNHYLVQKIRFASTFDISFYALAYCFIAFPTVILLTKIILNKYVKRIDINSFISSNIIYNHNMVAAQGTVLLLICICTISTAYVFSNLGYNPFIEMFRGGNIDYLRQSGTRLFRGNQYIKNLLMTTLTPFLSYYCYIYYKNTKGKTWSILFKFSLLLSVFALTYDFSKSPIIIFLLGFYLINVSLGNIENNKSFNRLVIISIVLLLFFYLYVSDAGRDVISIYSGPIGRILFTQIATLFLHFEVFPLRHDFLNGASFNSWMSFLIPNAEGLRSGRIVMSVYNASGVETNTAGVMNTLFIGEAYANYGIFGIIIAPIIFGIIIGFVAHFIPALKKNPVTVLLYVQLTLQFIKIVEGGFVDIFYSASTIFLLIISVLLYTVSSNKEYNERKH